jgi:predicted DNA-binding transcriptional regulator AlpA
MIEQLLSVKAVAGLLSVHPKTVWRWVKEGRLQPPIYIASKLPRWPANVQLTSNAKLPITEDYRGRQEK